MPRFTGFGATHTFTGLHKSNKHELESVCALRRLTSASGTASATFMSIKQASVQT